jgi:hypothetical protein
MGLGERQSDTAAETGPELWPFSRFSEIAPPEVGAAEKGTRCKQTHCYCRRSSGLIWFFLQGMKVMNPG